MPEAAVLEETYKPHFSDPSLARIGGLNSAKSRRLITQKAKAFDTMAVEILPSVQQSLQDSQTQDSEHMRAMNRLASHIERIDCQLDVCDTPAGWRDLSQARFKLFEQWAHLAGIPKPMAPREVRSTRRQVYVPAAPIEIAYPEPVIPQMDVSKYRVT